MPENIEKERLEVREMEESDIPLIIRYWLESGTDHLERMGVDMSKVPGREAWEKMLRGQLQLANEQKSSYCLIWLLDGIPVGHSNISQIVPGKEARMHLHLWNSGIRQQGLGTGLVKLSLPVFFSNYKLQRLYCEPYSLNPAPNRTLPKAGFQFQYTYRTIPGWLNFEQEVNCWMIEKTDLEKPGRGLWN